MVGIDLVEIERVERAMTRRPGLRDRLFTEGELAFAAAHRRPGRHLAARFAAKEATIKALGTSRVSPREVEVRGGGQEAPSLVLHGRAAQAAAEQDLELAVSLTHAGEIAAAVVVQRGP